MVIVLMGILVGIATAILGPVFATTMFLGTLLLVLARVRLKFILRALLLLIPLHGFLMTFAGDIPYMRYWKEGLLMLIGVTMLTETSRVLVTPLDVAVFGFASYVTVCTFAEGITSIDIYALGAYVAYVILYMAIRRAAWRPSDVEEIVRTLAISGAVVAVGAVVETVLGISLSGGVVEATRLGVDRASFSVGSALVLGPFMVFTIGLTFWIVGCSKSTNKLTRITLAFSIVVQIVVLIFTGTRAAWVQFIVSLVTAAILYRPRTATQYLMRLFILGVPLVAGAALLTQPQLLVNPLRERYSAWSTAVDLLMRHPITGIGPGMTLWATSSLRGTTYVTESYFLQLAVEMGLPALFCFVVVYVIAIIGLLSKVVVRGDTLSHVILALLIGYLPALVVAQSLNGWAMQAVFWTVLALSSGGAANEDRDCGLIAERAGNHCRWRP